MDATRLEEIATELHHLRQAYRDGLAVSRANVKDGDAYLKATQAIIESHRLTVAILEEKNRQLDALILNLKPWVDSLKLEQDAADWWRNGPPEDEPGPWKFA